MLINIDHITLVVRDLPLATAHYTTLLGCEPQWRGSGDGCEHCWFQLGNTALDIIAPDVTAPNVTSPTPGEAGNRARARLDAHGEGIWAVAFGTPDINKSRQVLERRGIASSAAQSIQSTHVITKERRAWTTSVLQHDATQGVSLLLVEQHSVAAQPLSTLTCEATAAVNGLDHIVITTPQPERAAALYGTRLGLEMKLDRSNPDWGSRLMFFKCGDLVVEVAHDLKKGVSDGPDHAWGLSWRVTDIGATHVRLTNAGVNVSEIRTGRKPGTQVFTARDHTAGVPTIMIGKT